MALWGLIALIPRLAFYVHVCLLVFNDCVVVAFTVNASNDSRITVILALQLFVMTELSLLKLAPFSNSNFLVLFNFQHSVICAYLFRKPTRINVYA